MDILIDPYRTPPALLTSTPYPIIVTEGVYSSAAPVNGKIFGWGSTELTSSADVVEGDLRIVFLKSQLSDYLRSTIELIDGELRDILKTSTYADEMTCAVDIVSGELRVILTRYQIRPEAIRSSADVIDGTLV